MKAYMSDGSFSKNLVLKSLSKIFFQEPIDKNLVQMISRSIIQSEYLYCKNEEKQMDGFIRNGLTPLLYEYILVHCGEEGEAYVMQEVKEDQIKEAKKEQYSGDSCVYVPAYFESEGFKESVGPIEIEGLPTWSSLEGFGMRVKGLLDLRTNLEFMYGTVLASIPGIEKYFENNIQAHINEIIKSQITLLKRSLEPFISSKYARKAAEELQLICDQIMDYPQEKKAALLELIQWQFQRICVGVRLDQIKTNDEQEKDFLRWLCGTLVPLKSGITRSPDYKIEKVPYDLAQKMKNVLGEKYREHIKAKNLSAEAGQLYYDIFQKKNIVDGYEEAIKKICEELSTEGDEKKIEILKIKSVRIFLAREIYKKEINKEEVKEDKRQLESLELEECILKLGELCQEVEKPYRAETFSRLCLEIRSEISHLKALKETDIGKDPSFLKRASHLEKNAEISANYAAEMSDISDRIQKCRSELNKVGESPTILGGFDGLGIWESSNQLSKKLQKELKDLEKDRDAARKKYQNELQQLQNQKKADEAREKAEEERQRAEEALAFC